MTENVDRKEGWGWPAKSRKAHYFRDGRSLCGSWMYFGAYTPTQTVGGPDDCLACAKKLEKEAKA